MNINTYPPSVKTLCGFTVDKCCDLSPIFPAYNTKTAPVNQRAASARLTGQSRCGPIYPLQYMTSEIQYHNSECKQYPDEKKTVACNNDFTGSGFTLYARANDKILFLREPLVTEFHTFVALSILAATMHACVSRSRESYCSVSVCYCPISMSIIRMNESKSKKRDFSISHGHCKLWISCCRQLLGSCCWYLLEIRVRSNGCHFSLSNYYIYINILHQ